MFRKDDLLDAFESSVNPEGSKTIRSTTIDALRFESSVNPEGSKTKSRHYNTVSSLRVV